MIILWLMLRHGQMLKVESLNEESLLSRYEIIM